MPAGAGALMFFCGGLVMALDEDMRTACAALGASLPPCAASMALCCFGEQGINVKGTAMHGNLMFGALVFSKQVYIVMAYVLTACIFVFSKQPRGCVEEREADSPQRTPSQQDRQQDILIQQLAWKNLTPPEMTLKLIEKWPELARVKDSAGNLPVHIACMNQRPTEVTLRLVELWPQAVKERDSEGRLLIELAL